jgi:hypothetical protein
MLFKEEISVYYETHTKYTNVLCGQNAKFYLLNYMALV